MFGKDSNDKFEILAAKLTRESSLQTASAAGGKVYVMKTFKIYFFIFIF